MANSIFNCEKSTFLFYSAAFTLSGFFSDRRHKSKLVVIYFNSIFLCQMDSRRSFQLSRRELFENPKQPDQDRHCHCHHPNPHILEQFNGYRPQLASKEFWRRRTIGQEMARIGVIIEGVKLSLVSNALVRARPRLGCARVSQSLHHYRHGHGPMQSESTPTTRLGMFYPDCNRLLPC
jgi:hypothetical protein